MVSAPEVRQMELPSGFLTEREVEPVGRVFLNQWARLHSNRGISHAVLSESRASDSEGEEENDEEIFEDDLEYLRSLDPKETKEQDHYKVLGLSNLRMLATDDQIKKAHRSKVLRHHPDKRKALGEEVKEDDDYFSCITKAFEQLENPEKRRAFDSVDPTFDDKVPKVLKKGNTEDFIKTFSPVFEANTQWSVKTPVPAIGDDNTSREEVDAFYTFWYAFDSWREYSYLDEEERDKAEDRWERREMDKMNKAERKERKAEETKRIRKLVDNAYNSDPRIPRFMEELRLEKLAKKKAKGDQAKAIRDEEERLQKEQEEAVEKEREAKENIEKAKKANEKKEKEVTKKLLKIERKKLRAIAKDENYFCVDEDEKVKHVTEVERICELYNSDQLKDLVAKLEDKENSREIFLAEMVKLDGKIIL